MPPINKPPIGLTDQEILCVIAYLQISWRHADRHAADETPLQQRRGRTGAAPAPAPAPAPGGATSPPKGTQ